MSSIQNENYKKRLKSYTRRDFIKIAAGGSVLGGKILSNTGFTLGSNMKKQMMAGPASRYVPLIKAAFVRRKGDYGMAWPGAIYDGETALNNYHQQIIKAERELGIKIDIRSLPIYSLKEADQWLNEAAAGNPDGFLVVVLDRQQHSWPTVYKTVETKIPTVVFSPIGTAFTTNTTVADAMSGVFICSTDDFSQAVYGIKMIKAGAKLRETRVVVLRGNERREDEIPHFGVKLLYLPAKTYLDDYNRIPITDEIEVMAEDYIKNATRMTGPTKQDVLNGVKGYVVARSIIEREGADAITMDCLGTLGNSKVSLPCIAWSKLNDDGVPAVCEADLTSVVKHCLVQYLFDRPGFQQDPVPDTAKNSLIGAHCSCPTRLNGFSEQSEPYFLSHHHGKRDAVPVTIWKIGQKVTVFDVVFNQRSSDRTRFAHRFPVNMEDERPEMIISTGEVIENISVPPSGGCVVSINVKLDNVNDSSDLLSYPGFHQLFFYGDFKKELKEYCGLFNIKQTVI